MSFTPFPVPYPTVFSFSLYGNNPLYTTGMIRNAEHIRRRFPGAEVWIYIADDVPPPVREMLRPLPSVRLWNVPRTQGRLNSFDRFCAADHLPDNGVLFVRDADSRVHERDAACIEDFLSDTTKQLHIIRDHRYHTQHIMGGMWGIRKDPTLRMEDLIRQAYTIPSMQSYLGDQLFLRQHIYPRYTANSIMIHDDHRHIDPSIPRAPFRVPVLEHAFVGQVYRIAEDGTESPVYV